MIPIKTKDEIKIMQEGGSRLRHVLEEVLDEVKSGVSKAHLDQLADREIKKVQGKPSFKMVPGYSWATCITVNSEVVHGIPNEQVLKEGDIVGVDIGLYFKGFHTDLATTVKVGRNVSKETDKFLEIGRTALEDAIKQAKVGSYIGDLSLAIQNRIEAAGCLPVKSLTGHGVGRKLHEEPSIPCFIEGKREKTPKIYEGMALAIEVIFNQGSEKVVLEEDGWTISTLDGKMSGLFEETVAVTKDGPLVLTR